MAEYIKAEGRLGKEKSGHLFGWKAESGSNVHLFWQTETTGPTHSGIGPSAEIRVKCKVEESSRVCARNVCLCVRALPQVSKA